MNQLPFGHNLQTAFIAKILLGASLLFSLFFLSLGETYLFYQSFGPMACLFVVIILSRFQFRRASNIFLILSINLALIYFTSLTGKDSSIHLLFIVLAVLPLIIFEKNEKWMKIISILITVLSYFLLEYTLFFQSASVTLPNISLELISIFSMVIIIGINLIIIQSFVYSTERYKDKLLSLNSKLELSNKNLVNSNNKLKESRDAQVLLTQHAGYAKLVQSIAHEFKNPLQMLQGTAELGLLKDKNNKEIFTTIINSVERLNNVIQPLLLYLNKKTAYTFAPFSMVTIIEEIMILSKANCKAKNIQLSFDNQATTDHINGDSQFIGQVVINLITNAIEAISDDGGTISIHLADDIVSPHNENINTVRLDIKDSGCGIPKEKINAIFMPYETVRHSENNVGLGLSIVAKIIKDHQGLIKVTSEDGQGTNVTVWLPVSKQKILDNESQTKPFELDDTFFEAA